MGIIIFVGRPPDGNRRTSVTSVDSIGQMVRGAASKHIPKVACRMPELIERHQNRTGNLNVPCDSLYWLIVKPVK